MQQHNNNIPKYSTVVPNTYKIEQPYVEKYAILIT